MAYMAKRMSHGDAERIYDLCLLLGLRPVPWQVDVLQRLTRVSKLRVRDGTAI